jgi:hypothetical protein
MPKTGRPWYRRQTDSWYVWLNGKQVMLATGRKNKAAAHARFAELLGEPPAGTGRAAPTVGELVEAYKSHVKDRIKATTLVSYAVVLASLKHHLGPRPAESVVAGDLEGWARRQGWAAATQRFALTVAGGAFRWAGEAGLLPAEQVGKLSKPPARSRGTEVLIDPALHERLLSVGSPEFRRFIEAVHATGARPGEIARLEAANVVWDGS